MTTSARFIKVIALTLVFIGAFVMYLVQGSQSVASPSVELGVAERSVTEGALGYAVPASHVSGADNCTVTVTPNDQDAGNSINVVSIFDNAYDPAPDVVTSADTVTQVVLQQPSWSTVNTLAASNNQNWAIPITTTDGSYRIQTTYQYSHTDGTTHTRTYTCNDLLTIRNRDLDPVSVTPLTVINASDVYFSAVVDNTGTLATGGFDSVFEVDTNGDCAASAPVGDACVDVTLTPSRSSGVSGGGNITLSTSGSESWTAGGSGNRVRVSVDINNEVVESDDTNNNTGWAAITVATPGVNPDPVSIGSCNQYVPCTFTYDMQNESSPNAVINVLFENELHIDFDNDCANNVPANDPCIDDIVDAGDIVNLPVAGQLVYPSYTPTNQGTYWVRFYADSGDDLAETNEGNNDTSWASFTVGAAIPIITFETSINGGGWQSGTYHTVSTGDSVELRWQTQNANSCSAIAGSGFSVSSVNGTDTVTTPGLGSSDTFTIACAGDGGNTQRSITIANTQGPQISASDTSVDVGDSVDITWDTNSIDPATCQLIGPSFNQNPIVDNPIAAPDGTESGVDSITIAAESTFVISCGAAGSASTTVTATGQIFES